MEGQTCLTLGKKRIKNEPSYIVFLHEKSDKPNSEMRLAASFYGRLVTPKKKKKMSLAVLMGKKKQSKT